MGDMISSSSNPRVRDAARLHRTRERRQTGMTLLEGPNLLEEALAGAARIDVVFAVDLEERAVVDAAARDIEIVSVNDRVLQKLAGTETPRGPVAVVRIPDQSELAPADTIVLCGVSDPGNVGALMRSAAAFAFNVVVDGKGADPWSPKALRSAAGAHFRTVVSRSTNPAAELRSVGCVVAALVVSGGQVPTTIEPDRPIALIVGPEAQGLGDEILTAADLVLTLKMPGGIESLNVAVAGSIVMYERSNMRV